MICGSQRPSRRLSDGSTTSGIVWSAASVGVVATDRSRGRDAAPDTERSFSQIQRAAWRRP